MVAQGGTVRWVIEADSSEFDQAVDSASQSIDKLTKKAKEADSSTKGGIFDNLTDQAKSAMGSLQGIGSSLGRIAWGTTISGATAATGALTSLVNKGIQATDFLETARTSMSGLTGSMEEGNKAMSIAANYWQNNPFQRTDVTKATQQLIQFGRTTGQISSDLDLLGNVSLSTGVHIDELARYYARTAASGRAMTLDIEMMSDRGIPIYRELAEALGTTTQGVREMASKGKIDFETFRKAMENAINPEAMKQYEDTLARQTDRLKGSISILAGQIAGYKIINDELVISESGLEKAWTRLLKVTATSLRSDEMKESMEKLGNAIAKVIDKIAEFVPLVINGLGKALDFITEHGEVLIPIFGGILAMLGRLGAGLPVIGTIIGGISGSFGSLGDNLLKFVKAAPGLSLIVGIFGTAFVSAFIHSEEFRQSIGELLKALGRLAGALGTAIQPILDALVKSFNMLGESGAAAMVFQSIASSITVLANALASIPTPVLTALITALLTMKVMSASPILGVVFAASTLVGVLGELGDIFPEITNAIKDFAHRWAEDLLFLPKQFAMAGYNAIIGFANGFSEGVGAVVDYVQQVANLIVNRFKDALGIHSPSKVMYGIGENITLGLANGINDSKSVAQKAMDSLATDILNTAQSVIQNKVDFGLLDYGEQYKEWKKVSKMFTVGSKQYASAIEKMESARKQANLKIIQLQQAYNNALDETISKIANMYSTFEKVDLTGGIDSSEIIGNLDKQVAQLQRWESAQQIISGLELDPKFIEELQAMGVDAVNELSAIAGMTSDELSTLNDLWLKKQSIANREGVRQMQGLKKDTLKEISGLKKNIDKETVDVQDVGGRLVANIGEGITGAIPTLEQAYSQLGSYMAQATKELASSGAGAGSDLGKSLEDALDIPNTTKSIKDSIGEGFDDIKTSVEEMVGNIIPVLAGVVGGIAAFKFGPRLLEALGTTGVGQKISGIFSGLFGKENVAKSAGEAVSKSKTIADSMSKVETNVGKTGKSVSKTSKVAVNIIKGVGVIVGIAIAIIAIAAALRGAYELLKDVNWESMVEAIGGMSLAIIAVGVLAGVVGAIAVQEAKGLLVILGIAIDIAAVAKAVSYAYAVMKPVEWEGFKKTLEMMAAAIGAFSGLSALTGILAPLEGVGLLMIAGICDQIGKVALACRIAYEYLRPVEWNSFKDKLKTMAATIGTMTVFDTVLGVLSPLVNASWSAVNTILNELIGISETLVIVDAKVPEDITRVNRKIDYVRDVIQKVADANLGNLLKLFSSSLNADPLMKVLQVFRETADAMSWFSVLTIDMGRVNNVLDEVVEAVKKVAGFQLPNSDYGQKEYAIGMASSIAWKLSEFSQALGNIRDAQGINDKIINLTGAIGTLLDGIQTNLNSKLGSFEELGYNIGSHFAQGVSNSGEQVYNAGANLQNAMWSAIEVRMMDEFYQGQTMANKFVDGLRSQTGSIGQVGADMQGSLWRAIQARMNDEYYQGRSLGERFRQGLYDIDYANAGWWAVQGFINGANNRAYGRDGAYHTGWWVADTFLKGLKDRGEQGSPWKTTFESGNWAIEGLIEGIASQENALVNEAYSLADQVVDALSMDEVSVSPELDARVSGIAPSMDVGGSYGGRREVVINQQNDIYTQYDFDKVQRDMRWSLSKI